jgi:hypothetical protein
MAEFTCCECKRQIISFGCRSEKVPEPPLCAACLMMPGWTSDPLLRERLGCGDLPNVPANQEALASFLKRSNSALDSSIKNQKQACPKNKSLD